MDTHIPTYVGQGHALRGCSQFGVHRLFPSPSVLGLLLTVLMVGVEVVGNTLGRE